jgi:hypothetical protein
MLTEEEKQIILSEFPNVKLSYENIIHKKVYPFKNNNYLMAMPYGKKCFAWFTLFKDKSVCFIFEIDHKNGKKIKKILIANCCFTSSLSYGTILYGTLFYHSNNSFFSIEDIFSYKGQDFSEKNYNDKLIQIFLILKNDIKQVSYNNNFTVFGLPIISQSYEDLNEKLKEIKYKISCIYHIDINNKNNISILPYYDYIKIDDKPQEIYKPQDTYKQDVNTITKKNDKIIIQDNKDNKVNINDKVFESQNKIFICKPDIQNDVYHLYSLNNKFIGLACIPDYKTSIMMNKLFRTIKENDDLDKLEESDDEEEFENPNVDKYVILDKSFKIECAYNKRFKKWVPIKLANPF